MIDPMVVILIILILGGVLVFKANRKFGRKMRLNLLRSQFALISAVDPFENLEEIVDRKKYVGANAVIVMGPDVNYHAEMGEGTASWLCKTDKNNWFLLKKQFVAEVHKGADAWRTVEPLTTDAARELLLHRDPLLYEQYFGAVEEA